MMQITEQGSREAVERLSALSGRPLLGSVWIHVADEELLLRSLHVKFAGKLIVDGRKRSIVKDIQNLLTSPVGHRISLQRGSHCFPFYVWVSAGFPSSGSSDDLTVRYSLKVEADIANGYDFTTKFPVYVESMRETIEGREPATIETEFAKNPTGAVGKLRGSISSPKWVRIGDDIELWLNLQNQCNRNVKTVDISLHKRRTNKRAKIKLGSNASEVLFSANNLQLRPRAYQGSSCRCFLALEPSAHEVSLLSPSFDNEYVSVEYFLRISLDVPGARDVYVDAPITLLNPIPAGALMPPMMPPSFSYSSAAPANATLLDMQQTSAQPGTGQNGVVEAISPPFVSEPTVAEATVHPQPPPGEWEYIPLHRRSSASIGVEGCYEQLRAAPYPKPRVSRPGERPMMPPRPSGTGLFEASADFADPASDDGWVTDDDLTRENCFTAGQVHHFWLRVNVSEPYAVLYSATASFEGKMHFAERVQRVAHLSVPLVTAPILLRRGSHRLPFSLSLPAGLPSSTFHAVLCQYSVSVDLDIGSSVSSIFVPVAVVNPCHLIEGAREHGQTASTEGLSEVVLPNDQGVIVMRARAATGAVTQQSLLAIDLNVDNHSSLFISDAILTLRLNSSLHPHTLVPPRDRRQHGVVASQRCPLHPRIYAGASCTTSVSMALDRMPSVIDPSFFFGESLWASYSLEVRLTLPGATDAEVTLPITILPHDPRTLRAQVLGVTILRDWPEVPSIKINDSPCVFAASLEQYGVAHGVDTSAAVQTVLTHAISSRECVNSLHRGLRAPLLDLLPPKFLEGMLRPNRAKTIQDRLKRTGLIPHGADLAWVTPAAAAAAIAYDELLQDPDPTIKKTLLLDPASFVPRAPSYADVMLALPAIRALVDTDGPPHTWLEGPARPDEIPLDARFHAPIPRDIVFATTRTQKESGAESEDQVPAADSVEE